MQGIDPQSPFDQTSLTTQPLQAAAIATDEPPSPPVQFQPHALVETLCQTAKVMIVDDSPMSIKLLQRDLEVAGYQHFVTSTDPRPVLDMMLKEMPDVLLTDIMMPHISGLELLQKVRADARLSHIPTIVLTASNNERTKIEALELGAADFLNKPVYATELLVRVRNALLMKAHHDHLINYASNLERQVRLRTAELAASRLELIHCLARTAEFRDSETGHHVVRVGRYAEIIARQLGMDEQSIELIGHAAPLHDMGKVGIPDSVLLKPGKLAPDEFDIMKKHSIFGQHAMEPLSEEEWRTLKSHTFMGEMIMETRSSPIIATAATIALTHHEKWDGTGYPNGLKGEAIPIAGRITAVADVFDALSSRRPYKPAFELDKCFTIMEESRGTHFDPNVLDAFLACREAVTQVQMEFADSA
jgi:putative two-component system response regulator